MFPMSDWPYRIPFDLHVELESRPFNAWEHSFRTWAKTHGLKLKLQWWPSLEQKVVELHARRYTAGTQDHWAAIREWLVQKGVKAPHNLPGWPEQE